MLHKVRTPLRLTTRSHSPFSSNTAISKNAAHILQYLAGIHTWFQSAIASRSQDVLSPNTTTSSPQCQKFIRTAIHRHKSVTRSRYCDGNGCHAPNGRTNEDVEYLCVQSCAPAWSYVTFKSGSAVQATSFSTIVAHHEEATGRHAFLVRMEPMEVWHIAVNGELVPYPIDGFDLEDEYADADDGDDSGDDDTHLGHTNQPTLEWQLLVFDCPSNSSGENDNLYKWVRVNDIPGSDVSVVSYDWGKGEWIYRLNPCTEW